MDCCWACAVCSGGWALAEVGARLQAKDGAAIEISDEDAEKIQTVQDAIDFIHDAGVEDE